MAQQARDIGIEVSPPAQACEDPKCPFHGTLPVRGIIIDGRVTSTKMEHSVVVKREFTRPIPKYERYAKRTTRIHAHLPGCIEVTPGDEVKIMECRPLSKTVSFVVVEARKAQEEVRGVDYTTEAPTATATDTETPDEGEEE